MIHPVRIAGNQNSEHDTVLLLYTFYNEPVKWISEEIYYTAIQVEDNLSSAEMIKTTSSIEDIRLSGEPSPGRLRRQGIETITYTATDEAGNIGTAQRNLDIRNIATVFAGVYETKRNSQYLDNSMVYNSGIVSDISVPGRLIFPKVYHYIDAEYIPVDFRVSADLWSPDYSNSYSTAIAFMGKSSAEKDIPFFDDMTYNQGIEAIKDFDRLVIDAQDYDDALGNRTVYIIGVEDDDSVPLSRIVYLEGTKTVKEIVLELQVTIDKGLETEKTDRITETYTPN